ncbi:hypothetical protein TNCV_1335361 [Trichonephila clavipes]|nr:hypothetical protein TNCV_1335361 [Trichonephila clavipes]
MMNFVGLDLAFADQVALVTTTTLTFGGYAYFLKPAGWRSWLGADLVRPNLRVRPWPNGMMLKIDSVVHFI